MGRHKKVKDRFEENRDYNDLSEAEMRYEYPEYTEDEIKKNFQMGYLDKLWVDETKRPDDMVYCWATLTVMGMEKPGGLGQMYRLGWKPVPLTRHPEFQSDSRLDGGRGKRDGIILISGNVLMERPKHLHDIDVKTQMRNSLQQLDLAKAMEKNNSVFPVQLGGFTSSRQNKVTMTKEFT